MSRGPRRRFPEPVIPEPTPEPVQIPDVEMDPTPNIVEIGSSANIVEMEPPPKLPENNELSIWEIQVINRGMSVIRKHNEDDSAYRKDEKLLIQEGLQILRKNNVDESYLLPNKKKQKVFENDESYLLHKDKKEKKGERHLMGFPLDFWGLKEEALTGFSTYTQYTQDTPSTASWRPSSGPPGSFYTTSTPNQGGVGRVTVTPTR